MRRDMKKELRGKINGNVRDRRKEFDKWRKEFNEVRPHEGLGMKRPKDAKRGGFPKVSCLAGGSLLPPRLWLRRFRLEISGGMSPACRVYDLLVALPPKPASPRY
jgi:hypothetical protein